MKIWIKKVFGFGLASLLSDLSHEMTVSLVPVMVAHFVGPAQAPLFLGIISGITDAFASFLRLVSGFLTDRLSHKKPLIALGYGLSGLFSVLVGFSHSVWELLTYRMLSFSGSGLREPPRDALIAATVGQENYGRSFGLRSAMDTIGSLIGPLVAFACAGVLSVKGIFLISGIPGILSVLAIVFLTKDIVVPAQALRISAPFWQDFLLLPRKFMLFLSILLIFDLGCINKLMLLSRAQELLGNGAETTRLLVLLYAIFNVSRAFGEFTIGFLSDYVNRVLLLAFFGCGLLSCVALLLLIPHASFLYCVLIFILFGLSAATTMTLKKACAADMLPSDIRGFGFGLLQASEGFAALAANIVLGFLWSHYSALLGFLYVIVLNLAAMFLLLLFAIAQRSR